ncbi:MAG TPA: extracellular solute-binding protein [Nitrospiraceae bacterium]|nr:extracellular solute-binding protein [Nitrospiraceae bacterium]
MFSLCAKVSIGLGAGATLGGWGATLTPKMVTAASAPVVTVDFWQNWPGILGKAVDRLAARFNAVQDSIVVKPLVTEVGNKPEKLLAAIAGRNPPDAVTLSDDLVLGFSSRDMLLPLDSLIAASKVIRRANYPDALWVPSKYQGKTYGVPAIENAPRLALGWNKTLFKAAGMDPERPPTTLEGLADMAEKLTKFDANKNLIQIGFDPLDAMGGGQALNTWARAFGADWYDARAQKIHFDTPEMAALVDYVTSFHKKYGSEKMAAFRQSYAMWSGRPEGSFPRGVEAMILEGYWAPGELKETAQPGNVYGWTWMPTRTGEKIQIMGGWNVCIPKGAKHVKEAFRFIEFLSTDDANLTILEAAGSFCATKSFATKTDFTRYGGMAWFMDSVTKANKVYGAVLCPVFAEAKARLQQGLDEVSFGRKTAKEMLAGLQSTVQDALDKALRR